MRIAVVDDDTREQERLKGYLNELVGEAAQVCCFSGGEAFLTQWQPGEYDLILLDIFMGKLTGMDVAREIRKSDKMVKLAFSTSSNEFASESYQVNACYYLRKPVDREGIEALLDRIDLAELERLRTAKLPDGTTVRLRNIIYVDCAAHCITLHGKDGRSCVVRATFSEIEDILCAYPYFFSPTKGVIVNFYEVAEQSKDTFTMTNGECFPISRRKAHEVLDAYSSFLFEQLRKGGRP